ncbi:Fc.00g112160.m01.CDS01 [Cosmosporella sp. VM-42]
MESAAAELAGTIQAGSINRHPDPKLDINPSTAAEKKERVTLHSLRHGSDDGVDDDDEEDIPYSVLRPAPRSYNLPPLPDLRFEQSYLRSISAADTWWKVVLITTRDQVMMPLAQGVVYNLFLCGWQHWNRNARLHGNTVGARVRRWWWGVNNWKIPNNSRKRL